uniref:Reverse transcriptase domain-containing protein n=1 Tax=Oryza sativa subsp. japonica TaxID=39947 RepID=Q6ATG8_ORYSJ|nr:hypothetical protein [Oryza sativa Japonica Group]
MENGRRNGKFPPIEQHSKKPTMGRPNTVLFGPGKENIYNHQSQEAKRGKIIPAAQVTNFIRRNNVGFGRSIGRKGALHTIPHGLHGLGRSSNLTLTREGLVGGWHEALRLNLPKPVAKAMKQERREAKSRTSALPGQRRLRRMNKQVADRIVSPTQTAFMRGRNILDRVVVIHETVRELHRRKLSGVILKIDFEKAYDKVKWPFLLQTLRMKGFSPRWISWIESFISGGSVAIKVNDDIGRFFQTKKGLRQGDPLSPILFNIIADMLAVMIQRANNAGQLVGLVHHLIDGGLSILQYADDIILFMEHDLEKACNLKMLLNVFEELSGLKINFHKSELYCFGEAQTAQDQYTNLFQCEAILQKVNLRGTIIAACQQLELVAMEFSTPAHGWRSRLRLEGS